jgi:hypothetical protein
MANNKILCWLKTYNLHRKPEGYLYIKDGDNALFITNVAITPKTSIEKVSQLSGTGSWTEGLSVQPGKKVEIKIEGEGLHKARFAFEDIQNVEEDTLIKNENLRVFEFQVPLTFTREEIQIFNRGKKTGYSLKLKEYQKPREFDFVKVNLGNRDMAIHRIDKPILHENTLKDIIISFDRNLIDANNDLHGKQYLEVSVRVTSQKNDLIELKELEDIVICPGEQSPRYLHYDKEECLSNTISLNKHVNRKTYNLEEWSKIQLTFKHKKSKYGGKGMKKTVEIILKEKVKFDVDVSFPAGLVTKKVGEPGFGNLGGISMAMIAEFSFYHPDKIAKLRPYKVGAGFLALNAFNFDENNDNRDVGVVILGSVYPISSTSKLSFPLYLGGGYLLKEGKPFFLIGPGIRVKL